MGAQGGRLEGVGLTSLQMVLFRGETVGQGDVLAERRGTEWRGARVDELRIAVYPADADVPLEPGQKHLRKRGSLTVLERLH